MLEGVKVTQGFPQEYTRLKYIFQVFRSWSLAFKRFCVNGSHFLDALSFSSPGLVTHSACPEICKAFRTYQMGFNVFLNWLKYLRYISSIYQTYLRHISDISHISNISQAYLRHTSGLSQAYIRNISDKSQEYLRDISEIYQAYLRHTSGISQAYIRYI